MSDWHVEVVEIKELKPHGNADKLEITMVEAYPVIVKKGEFKVGDKAVYIPVNSMVPLSDPRFTFLSDNVKSHHRVKAIKLRGVFSMGLLVAADPDMQVGENVADRLGIFKYEPPEQFTQGGENERENYKFVKFTDIESYRKYPRLIQYPMEVVVTEKIHGANSRFGYVDGEFMVGSHNCIKRRNSENLYWKIAEEFELEEKLKAYPNIIVFGEIFGPVQNLKYGYNKPTLRLFDAFSITEGKYFDYQDFIDLAKKLEIPTVPELYRGPWSDSVLRIPEDQTTHVSNVDQIMEGIVIRPLKETIDSKGNRIILKHIGEKYLLKEI